MTAVLLLLLLLLNELSAYNRHMQKYAVLEELFRQ